MFTTPQSRGAVDHYLFTLTRGTSGRANRPLFLQMVSADGRSAWLVFSGDDSFSIRRATLELVSDWQTTRIPVNRGDSD